MPLGILATLYVYYCGKSYFGGYSTLPLAFGEIVVLHCISLKSRLLVVCLLGRSSVIMIDEAVEVAPEGSSCRPR